MPRLTKDQIPMVLQRMYTVISRISPPGHRIWIYNPDTKCHSINFAKIPKGGDTTPILKVMDAIGDCGWWGRTDMSQPGRAQAYYGHGFRVELVRSLTEDESMEVILSFLPTKISE